MILGVTGGVHQHELLTVQDGVVFRWQVPFAQGSALVESRWILNDAAFKYAVAFSTDAATHVTA
jgi:hypothetical protein